MNDKRNYVFVGNRGYVLKEMINKNLNLVAVWVIENSFLHKILTLTKFVDYSVIKSKADLIKKIENTAFDVLVSNGCKYILPISKLKPALYVNIHPSFLPDLKGKDPINGAVLLNKNSGATCHMMDDGIDSGKIISRFMIKMSSDIDSAILFQLAFKAEVIVFNETYKRNFIPLAHQPKKSNALYYSSNINEQLIDFDRNFNYVIRQVKAFGYRSKGIYFKYKGKNYRFHQASEIKNRFVKKEMKKLKHREIYLVFENSIVFRYFSRVMRFDMIENMNGDINVGDLLENGDINLI